MVGYILLAVMDQFEMCHGLYRRLGRAVFVLALLVDESGVFSVSWVLVPAWCVGDGWWEVAVDEEGFAGLSLA